MNDWYNEDIPRYAVESKEPYLGHWVIRFETSSLLRAETYYSLVSKIGASSEWRLIDNERSEILKITPAVWSIDPPGLN
jgi:hypothetical protein